ncbi:hypothetical protein FRC09_014353 [Ceratobasidium sp. 395]|nr:hypothetical protein FRC09_014353 [Ceratobasidium sp. 395]
MMVFVSIHGYWNDFRDKHEEQEVLAGEVPFAGMETIAVLYAVGVKKEVPKRPDLSSLFRNKTLEDELWDLLTHCWNYEPTGRPSASELKKRLVSIW